jgi:hypothetical protein
MKTDIMSSTFYGKIEILIKQVFIYSFPFFFFKELSEDEKKLLAEICIKKERLLLEIKVCYLFN